MHTPPDVRVPGWCKLRVFSRRRWLYFPWRTHNPELSAKNLQHSLARDTWFASFNVSRPSPPLALGSHLSPKVISFFRGGRQAAHSDIEGRSNSLILYEIICHSYYLMIQLGLRFFHSLYDTMVLYCTGKNATLDLLSGNSRDIFVLFF